MGGGGQVVSAGCDRSKYKECPTLIIIIIILIFGNFLFKNIKREPCLLLIITGKRRS